MLSKHCSVVLGFFYYYNLNWESQEIKIYICFQNLQTNKQATGLPEASLMFSEELISYE